MEAPREKALSFRSLAPNIPNAKFLRVSCTPDLGPRLRRYPEFKVGIPAMSIVFLTAAVTTTMSPARLFLRQSVNVSFLWDMVGRRGRNFGVEKGDSRSRAQFLS